MGALADFAAVPCPTERLHVANLRFVASSLDRTNTTGVNNEVNTQVLSAGCAWTGERMWLEFFEEDSPDFSAVQRIGALSSR